MLSLLEPLAPAELNEWVQEPTFRRELRKLTKREQKSILDLLCKERIQALGVDARAAIIKALCKGLTWRHFETAIGEIFLSTKGQDLTRLKRAVDRCEDHRDLTHVLYDDIDVDAIREDIVFQVMFGDSGQADPEFLCEALDRYPGEIRGASLHRLGPMSDKRQDACLSRGVVLYETYVGAALHLNGLGLLNPAALGRTVEAAQKQLAQIQFPDVPKRLAREFELARDVEMARPLLKV